MPDTGPHTVTLVLANGHTIIISGMNWEMPVESLFKQPALVEATAISLWRDARLAQGSLLGHCHRNSWSHEVPVAHPFRPM